MSDGRVRIKEALLISKSIFMFDFASDARYTNRTECGLQFARPDYHLLFDDYSF